MSDLPVFDVDDVMQRDVAWLKRRHRQLSGFRGPEKRRAALLDEYRQRLERSAARRRQRRARRPESGAAADLPIAAHADRIVEAIEENQVVIVAGETGSGKRSEEHTSELQSRGHLVCRLLLEKK